MDKISKFIKSLTLKDRQQIIETMKKIRSGDISNLDIKKLHGFSSLFRIRIGKYRIICQLHRQYGFVVKEVKLRDDTTYNL
jgi:mRNA-degrading endonuclease RelE of RelBE toxin-antitoxin system